MRFSVCFIVVVFTFDSVLGGVEHECRNVQEYFVTKGIETDTRGQGPTCGGPCCSLHTEMELKARVRKDFGALVTRASPALQSLFTATASTIYDHVMELSKQSQNQTHYLFLQLYKRMALHAKRPTENFYNDIREYVNINHTDIGSPPIIDIEKSTTDFFKNIFPLVYHNTKRLQNQDFSEDYKVCLKEAFKEIQPFADIPSETAKLLSKSLEATRVLLQSLSLGTEVLNATDVLLAETSSSHSSCHDALLRMTYCPKCKGINSRIKPCHGFCLNVLRGCLTQNVAELDSTWSSYVDAIERLVTGERSAEEKRSNTDSVLRKLANKISEGIMHALASPENLDKRVKRACGHARTVELSELYPPSTVARDPKTNGAMSRPDPLRVSPPDTQMLQFVASVAPYKIYFNMANTFCQDEELAEQDDTAECWNGEAIGSYSKSVVEMGANSQKYNPEVVTTDNVQDNRVSRLADRLRHVRQLIMTHLSHISPTAESFSVMQRDEAGAEGSGSGGREGNDDEDNYDGEGSGSGAGGMDTADVIKSMTPNVEASTKPISSAPTTREPTFMVLLLLASAITTLSRWHV